MNPIRWTETEIDGKPSYLASVGPLHFQFEAGRLYAWVPMDATGAGETTFERATARAETIVAAIRAASEGGE